MIFCLCKSPPPLFISPPQVLDFAIGSIQSILFCTMNSSNYLILSSQKRCSRPGTLGLSSQPSSAPTTIGFQVLAEPEISQLFNLLTIFNVRLFALPRAQIKAKFKPMYFQVLSPLIILTWRIFYVTTFSILACFSNLSLSSCGDSLFLSSAIIRSRCSFSSWSFSCNCTASCFTPECAISCWEEQTPTSYFQMGREHCGNHALVKQHLPIHCKSSLFFTKSTETV